MILLSITLTRRADVHWLAHETGRFFPAEWARFRDAAPASDRDDLVAAYYRVPKHRHIVQVWDYRHRRAGFVRDACLTAPASLASLS